MNTVLHEWLRYCFSIYGLTITDRLLNQFCCYVENEIFKKTGKSAYLNKKQFRMYRHFDI